MGDKIINTLLVILIIIILCIGAKYIYNYVSEEAYVGNLVDTIQGDIDSNNNNFNDENQNKFKTNESIDKNQASQIVIPSVNETYNTSSSENTNESIIKSPSTISSTYRYNNHYYYNQLDDYAKAIYDVIANNIENIKTGNYVMNIDYNFTDLLKQTDGEKKLDHCYGDAINAINLDIPNLFYIDFSKMSLNIETTTSLFGTKYKLYINSGEQTNYFAEGFSSKSQVENAISKVESIKNAVCKNANGNDYEKTKLSHDWIIEYLEYSDESSNRANIYGALIEKKVVCEGYSRVYKYILDELGITNILATGTGTNSKGKTEDHMWNYVKLGDIWYAVDVTWDDPIVTGGVTLSNATKHKYFLIGRDQFFENHIERRSISSSGKEFTLPTLSNSKY